MIDKTKNPRPPALIQINAPDCPHKALWDKFATMYLENKHDKKFIKKMAKELTSIVLKLHYPSYYSPAVFNFLFLRAQVQRQLGEFIPNTAYAHLGSSYYYGCVRTWLTFHATKGDNYQWITSGRRPEKLHFTAVIDEVNKALASIHYRNSCYGQALESIEKIALNCKQEPYYKAFIGQCLYMSGRPWAALEELEKCLDNIDNIPFPDNENIKTYASHVKARALYQLKEFSDMRDEIAKALSCNPTHKALITANKTLRRALNFSAIVDKAGEIITNSLPLRKNSGSASRKNLVSKKISTALARPLYINFIEPENDYFHCPSQQRHNDDLAPARAPY